MATAKKQFETVNEYIKTFPKDMQTILRKIRQTIRKTAPTAKETISYEIPTYKLNEQRLVYFAGWKNHVAFYPVPSGDEAFNKHIAKYITGRGTLQFPLKEPIPYDLVKKIVLVRLKKVRGKRNKSFAANR